MKEQREKASLVSALKIIEGCEPDENGQCLRSSSWFKLVYLSQEDGQHHGSMGLENLGNLFFVQTASPPPDSTLAVPVVYVCEHPLCV